MTNYQQNILTFSAVLVCLLKAHIFHMKRIAPIFRVVLYPRSLVMPTQYIGDVSTVLVTQFLVK
jgi:hypothetical protein